jgi:hypothetical protein
MHLHHNNAAAAHDAAAIASMAVIIGDQPVAPLPLILDWIHT